MDVERRSLNLDPAGLQGALSPRTRGIIAVHTFGHPCAMDPITAFARAHDLFVIEDACEGLGATYKGRPAGSLGDVAVHSFYANKMITTGNGGGITTSHPELAALLRELRGYSYSDGRLFWHTHLPFNQRISAMQAAVGRVQLARLQEILAGHRRVARGYRARLEGVPGLLLPAEPDEGEHTYWMFTIHIEADQYGADATTVRRRLAAHGVETRAVFTPLHVQPVLQGPGDPQGPFPQAEWAAQTGINLPSSPHLNDEELDLICAVLRP